MPRLRICLAVFLFGLFPAGMLPSEANAQVSGGSATENDPGGFFLDGFAEAGAIHDSGSDDRYFRGSFNMGIRPTGGEGLGATLGIELYDFNNAGLDLSGFYPALTYRSFLGSFSVGNPRSVVDAGYGPDIPFAHSTTAEVLTDLAFGSLVNAATLADHDSIGLRYDGGLGNAVIGASVHRIRIAGSRATEYAFAFSLPITGSTIEQGLSMFGGAERRIRGDSRRLGFIFGAQLQRDRYRGMFRYRKTVLGPDTHLYEGRFEYLMSERVSLNLGLAHSRSGGTGTSFYGLGAAYEFNENGYIRGSILGGRNIDGPALDVSAGFRF